MKRSILFLISGLLVASSVHADDAKTQDLSTYLDQLQIKLEHTAQRSNQPSSDSTNVVGLRGSKQAPVSKQLYWKGKSGKMPVSPDEIKAFRIAIEDAQAGQKALAIASLKSFEEKYPKSGLRDDADDTLKMLSSAALQPSAAPPASVSASVGTTITPK